MFLATEIVFFFAPKSSEWKQTKLMTRHLENGRCASVSYECDLCCEDILSHLPTGSPSAVVFKNLMTNMSYCRFFFLQKLTYGTAGKCDHVILPRDCSGISIAFSLQGDFSYYLFPYYLALHAFRS